MAASRKSTPRRARSSSVVSNTSVASTRSAAANTANTSTGAASSTGTPSKKKAPATPRRSKAKASNGEGGATPSSAAAKKAAAAAAKSLTPVQAKAVAARPALPKERNPRLPTREEIPVKLQIIRREGANIIIGRVKLPTTNGADHAFLLRRFDTNAIAASSMFRLAFPFASGEAERAEMEYIEKRFDANAANGGLQRIHKKPRGRPSKKALEAAAAAGEELPFEDVLPEGSTGVRLQGTWVPSADGLELAKEYGLERFARPLVEAEATQGTDGAPILTPSKFDTVSTPTSGKADKQRSLADESPSITHTRTTKRAKEDGSQEISVEKHTVQSGLSSKEIEKQIKESQALAKGIQANVAKGGSASTPARKRRAAHQSPSANVDALADQEDYEHSNAVVRSFRRGTRAARRRPIATTAGALGAAGAVGAGALAWMAGGNLDVAAQLVQQSVQNIGTWFF